MQWDKLLEIEFGVFFKKAENGKPGEREEWAVNLKHTVFGWDKMDGANINAELCETLRHIALMDATPRADYKKSSSRYTSRDVRKWVGIYRRHRDYVSANRVSFTGVTPFAKRVKEHISDLIKSGRIDYAKEVSADPFIDLHRFDGQPDYTDEERADVIAFVGSLLNGEV